MPTRRRRTRATVPRRTMSERHIRRIANRADEARIKKVEGRWQTFLTIQTHTVQSSGGQNFVVLPRPNTTLVGGGKVLEERKMTIYALNSMIAISATSAYSTAAPILGAMAATKQLADEDTTEWPFIMNPNTVSGGEGQDPQREDNERPWRWWQPFIVDIGEGSPRRTQAFPYTFRRGKEIVLGQPYRAALQPHHEEYGIIFYTRGEQGVSLQISWWGRYRFIERAAS